MYFKEALVKVELGLCTGKKLFDKREDMRKKVEMREVEKALKFRRGMSAPRVSVTVRVPGSTSNCGAGFDTLGLALKILQPGHAPRRRRRRCRRPSGRRTGEPRTWSRGRRRPFSRRPGLAPAGFRYRIDGDVPAARGLGSSVTVIAGVLAGLDALHGTGWDRDRLVALATEQEGHPDNASAGILGGFCVSRCDPADGRLSGHDPLRGAGGRSRSWWPRRKSELLTKESRGALPASLPYFDAVRSVNSAAYPRGGVRDAAITRSCATRRATSCTSPTGCRGSLAAGRRSRRGSLRAPHRLAQRQRLERSLRLRMEPTAPPVAAAMKAAFAAAGAASGCRILEADNQGLRGGMIHVVLFEPEIPQNTGNVGRMCACTRSRLHLIHPLGFKITDRHLRRAGMDYWYELDVRHHADWTAFRASPDGPARLWLFTTKTERSFWEADFADGDGLVFGNEGSGAPDWLHAELRGLAGDDSTGQPEAAEPEPLDCRGHRLLRGACGRFGPPA